MASRIVFLDRDGTINIDHGYVTNPDKVDLIPGVAEAISLLKKSDFTVVIVSNQSAIGRGYASREDVDATNEEIRKKLLAEDPAAIIDLIVYSPDHPDQSTDTRKPGIGMLREVSIHYDIDLENSWVVGDKQSDVKFGLNAGLDDDHCLLVLSGEEKSPLAGILSFKSLVEAAKHIVNA